MAAARRLVALGRAARTDAKVKVRQPLRRALLLHPGVALDDDVGAEIADELNVKALEDVDTLSDLLTWNVIANFRAARALASDPTVNEVKAALAAADGSALQRPARRTAGIEVAGDAPPATTSRSGPNATRRSRWPRTAAGRWRSISTSTTTCGPRAWPASSSAPSTTCGRSTAWPSPTASGCGSAPARSLRPRCGRTAWVSEEVLAVSLDVFDASATEPSRVVTANGSTHEIEMDGEPGVVIIAKT